MRFTNRVAIVTGGARGIGKAIAARLASEGATVVIADVLERAAEVTAKELGGAGHTVLAFPVDVTDSDGVKAMVQAVLQRCTRIDILVNNAGILGDVIPIRETPDAEWHRVMAVNLHGVFYCTRAVLPAMLSRKYGRIVSLASVAGKEGNANMAAYSVSKAGVIALTKSLAKEHAQDGITVNCVTPALTDTDMIKAYSPEQQALLRARFPWDVWRPPRRLPRSSVFWLRKMRVSSPARCTTPRAGARTISPNPLCSRPGISSSCAGYRNAKSSVGAPAFP